MKKIFFMFFAALNKYSNIIRCRYYQFYNLYYLKYKGAIIGSNCMMNGKMSFSLNNGSTIEIGDNFICRSGYRGHILGDELSSFHISGEIV